MLNVFFAVFGDICYSIAETIEQIELICQLLGYGQCILDCYIFEILFYFQAQCITDEERTPEYRQYDHGQGENQNDKSMFGYFFLSHI